MIVPIGLNQIDICFGRLCVKLKFETIQSKYRSGSYTLRTIFRKGLILLTDQTLTIILSS